MTATIGHWLWETVVPIILALGYAWYAVWLFRHWRSL